MRGAPGAPLVSRRVSPEFRARACVFSPAPRSLSPKLETTRSLANGFISSRSSFPSVSIARIKHASARESCMWVSSCVSFLYCCRGKKGLS